MEDFKKLIEDKKASDRKQRRVSLIVISIFILITAIVFLIVIGIRKENSLLIETLDTTKVKKDSLAQILNDTVKFISKRMESEIIECIGNPTGRVTPDGIPLYNLTMRISDTSIVSDLKKVEYYFDDDTYSPKLKVSNDSSNFFRIRITSSWGCLPRVPVYLYYKNDRVDTIIFPMCDKIKIQLSERK